LRKFANFCENLRIVVGSDFEVKFFKNNNLGLQF